jgi:hypothetical protein
MRHLGRPMVGFVGVLVPPPNPAALLAKHGTRFEQVIEISARRRREGAAGRRGAGPRRRAGPDQLRAAFEIGVDVEEIVCDGAEVALEFGLTDGHLSRSGTVLNVVLGYRAFRVRLVGVVGLGRIVGPDWLVVRSVGFVWLVARTWPQDVGARGVVEHKVTLQSPMTTSARDRQPWPGKRSVGQEDAGRLSVETRPRVRRKQNARRRRRLRAGRPPATVVADSMAGWSRAGLCRVRTVRRRWRAAGQSRHGWRRGYRGGGGGAGLGMRG